MLSRAGVPTASGQKTTLSQCGIGPSQRAMPLRWNSPSRLIARVRIAERVAIIVGVRGERVGVLLSEVICLVSWRSIHALSEV